MRTSDGWLAAALVPLVLLAPVLWRVATGRPRDRLIALNLAQLLAALALLLASQGFARSSYLDLALLLAVLAPAGTLVFARFVGGVPAAPFVRRIACAAVPATVLPLCAAGGVSRQSVKLLVIGALLVAGSVVTSSGTQESAEADVADPAGGGTGPGAAGGGAEGGVPGD